MSKEKMQKANSSADRLQNRSINQEQRKRIRAFDRELFSYTGQVAWLLPGLFSFLVMILVFIPVQEVEKQEPSFYIWIPMFAIWISAFILQPYLNTTEPFAGTRQKLHRTYDKLKYLPVSRRQYTIVRLGYLFRYTWKLAAAGICIQCLSAALIAGYADICNVVYAVAVLFVVPMLAGWMQIILYR